MNNLVASGIDPILLWRKALGMSYSRNTFPGPLGVALALVGDASTPGSSLTSSLRMSLNVTRDTRIGVAIVGCGGTGSHLVPNIVQYLASRKLTLNTSDSYSPRGEFDIFLIDGDEVDQRNLLRQKFAEFEVGSNKAKALATRYSDAWGVGISYYEGYVDKSSLEKLFGANPQYSYDLFVIFGAVDNHRARMEISSYVDSLSNADFAGGIYWIDGGNESNYGQAIISGNPGSYIRQSDGVRVRDWKKAKIGDAIKPYRLPSFFARHPEALSKVLDSSKKEPSCLELSEIDPQTIQANMMSAYCMTSLFTQLMSGYLHSTAIYFDSVTGNTKSRFITKESILEDLCMIDETKAQILKTVESMQKDEAEGVGDNVGSEPVQNVETSEA